MIGLIVGLTFMRNFDVDFEGVAVEAVALSVRAAEVRARAEGEGGGIE